MCTWIGEENEDWGISIKGKVKEILLRKKSKNFDEIIVGESLAFGKILILKEGKNYTWQVAERWDSYSEMIVHVPLCAHPDPRKILVIGGGDGSTIREILKHSEVEKVVLVDIDEDIVRAGREVLKIDNGGLENEKVEVKIMDANLFVQQYDEEIFDVIIGDYSDPQRDSPAEILIKKSFLINIKRLLSKDGIISMQAGSPIFQKDIFTELFSNMKSLFRNVFPFVYPVPFYPGGLWSFIAASDTLDPRKPMKKFRNAVFYNEKVHEQAFNLPTFMLDLINKHEA